MSDQFQNEQEQSLYLASATGMYEVAPRASIQQVDEHAWGAVLAYRARCQFIARTRQLIADLQAVPGKEVV